MNLSRWIAIGLIALVAVINLYSLEQYPMPHADEAIYAEIGFSFYERGAFTTELYGARYGLDENHINSGRVYHLIEGAALRIVRSLWMARLISYLGWLVGILACFLAGRALYDEQIGLISAVVFASSMRALFSSHFGRPEIWVVAGSAISLWVMVIALQRPTPRRMLILGLVAVPGLGFHPMGIWFAGAVGLIVLVETIRTRQWSALAMFLLGSAIATAIFAYLHLMPDPARTLEHLQNPSWFYGDRNPLSGSFMDRFTTLDDFFLSAYVTQLNNTVIPFTLYFLVSVIMLLITRRRADRILLGFTFASLLAFMIGLQFRSRYYSVLWDASMAICIGAGMAQLAKRIWAKLRPASATTDSAWLVFAAIAPLALIAAAAWGYLSMKFHDRSLESYTNALHEHVPEGVRVLADTSLWWVFVDRNPFVSDWDFFDWVYMDGPTPGEVISREQIEYIVDDQTTVADDAGGSGPEALTAYLRASCEAVGTIEDRWFGRGGQIGEGVPTVIYRCTP